MFLGYNNWNGSAKKILHYLLLFLTVILALKIACYFMPFLIALVIANLIEPFIKKISEKTGLVRKKSAILALIVFFFILIGIIVIFSILVISEISDLLRNFNGFGSEVFENIEQIGKVLRLEYVNVSEDVKAIVVEVIDEMVLQFLNYLKSFLNSVLNLISRLPSFVICLVITILATYFISTNKIAILDEIEQKVPKKWIRKFTRYFNNSLSGLVKYLKAELILVFISFVLVLISLYIFRFLGMKIESPFLIALGIGFVDLLPILGSGTVMVPWGIVEIAIGNTVLGVSILCLLIFISLIRQLLEPKIVSNHLGVNPLYTLIAMYTGFKVYGVIGLVFGPVVLVVLMEVLGIDSENEL